MDLEGHGDTADGDETPRTRWERAWQSTFDTIREAKGDLNQSALILGEVASGKTFITHALLLGVWRPAQAKVAILDLDTAYRHLADLVNGQRRRLDNQLQTSRLCTLTDWEIIELDADNPRPQPRMLEAVCDALDRAGLSLPDNRPRVLVVDGTGIFPTDAEHRLTDSMKTWQERGGVVLTATQDMEIPVAETADKIAGVRIGLAHPEPPTLNGLDQQLTATIRELQPTREAYIATGTTAGRYPALTGRNATPASERDA